MDSYSGSGYFKSGMQIEGIFAFFEANKPFSESSNIRAAFKGTSTDFHALRKISGFGLDSLTLSPPITKLKYLSISARFKYFNTISV